MEEIKMFYKIGIEESKQFKKFLEMSPDDFDKYMCRTYPEMFVDRNKSMQMTCMCWGFCIGKGWYYYLDELCKKLKVINKYTGVGVIFSQIKEKYASGRFYTKCYTYGIPNDYYYDPRYNLYRGITNFIKHICIRIINALFYRRNKKELEIIFEIIDELIHNTESRVGHISEESGKYIEKPVYDGSWAYALTQEEFEKRK